MTVPDAFFAESLKLLLAMTLTGSLLSVFLFAVKGIARNRLPRSIQYDMWLGVIVALLIPLPRIAVLPAGGSDSGSALRSVHDVAEFLSDAIVRDVPSAPAGADRENLAPPTSSPGIATVFFLIWLSGAVAVFGYKLFCYARYVKQLKEKNLRPKPWEVDLLKELSGDRRVPGLYKNTMTKTPLLIGIFRPAILLPDKSYTASGLRNIFLHELTHLRKGDIAVKWLFTYVCALHWFNPIAQLARREADRACELACDEAVIKNCNPDEIRQYGDALIEIAAGAVPKKSVSVMTFSEKKYLKERLRVIRMHKKYSRRFVAVSGVCVAGFICGFLAVCSVRHADKAADPAHFAESALSEELRKPLEISRMEISLKNALCNADPSGIVDAQVFLKEDAGQIFGANIVILCEEIPGESVKNDISALIARTVSLDDQAIHVKYLNR